MNFWDEHFDPFVRKQFETLRSSMSDFAFGNSLFIGVDGNPDSLSVSGVGAGVADIANARRSGDIPDPRHPDRKDDRNGMSANDLYDLIMETRDRVQKDQLLIGDMVMSREEVDSTIKFLNDPANKEKAARAYARQTGRSLSESQADMDRYARYLEAKRAQQDGNATPEQERWLAKLDADPRTAVWLRAARNAAKSVGAEANAQHGASLAAGSAREVIAHVSSADAATGDAILSNVHDDQAWRSGREAQGFSKDDIARINLVRSSESTNFSLSDERQDSRIAATYNSAASPETDLTAQTDAGPSRRLKGLPISCLLPEPDSYCGNMR